MKNQLKMLRITRFLLSVTSSQFSPWIEGKRHIEHQPLVRWVVVINPDQWSDHQVEAVVLGYDWQLPGHTWQVLDTASQTVLREDQEVATLNCRSWSYVSNSPNIHLPVFRGWGSKLNHPQNGSTGFFYILSNICRRVWRLTNLFIFTSGLTT